MKKVAVDVKSVAPANVDNMKNKYFIKPFESFFVDKHLTLKQKWVLALRDPAYLIISGILIFLYITVFYIIII